MALSPIEVLLGEIDTSKANQLEAEIDAGLRSTPFNGRGVSITFKGDYPDLVIQEVICRFLRNGWRLISQPADKILKLKWQ